MPVIDAAPPINKLITPHLQIRKDFLRLGKGVILKSKAVRSLSFLSREQYAGVLRMIHRLNSSGHRFARLRIDPPGKINNITSLPDEYFMNQGGGRTVFDYLSVEFLSAQIDRKNMVLNLSGLQGRINAWISEQRNRLGSGQRGMEKEPAENTAGRLIDIIARERLNLHQMMLDPHVTVDKLSRAIEQIREKLSENANGDPSVRTELALFLLEAVRAVEALRAREQTSPEPIESPPQILIPKASRLLTDDLLFNPKMEGAYPRNAEEYHTLMAGILDAEGRFPGDSEPLTGKGTFSPKARGVSHLSLKRRGKKFTVEVLSPHLHAPELKNRLIFDADLISQAASFAAYGTPGVSYDRESYYVRRLFNAEKVPFIRYDGWPVSFAAMQGYEMSYEGRELYYAFIHFVMTYGFQGYGLTSYSVREGMSSLFYTDAWENNPNLFFNSKGELKDYRFRMWAAAHSGRFAPFYSFVKGFGGVDPSWDPVAQSIFRDVHQRITPVGELRRRGDPIPSGSVPVNGGIFPLAVDRGVYPPYARYPEKNGRVDFPQSELGMSSSIRKAWLKEIGGEEGVAEGNSLYFGGVVTLGKIREAKRREKKREGSTLERAGDGVRSWVVRHTK